MPRNNRHRQDVSTINNRNRQLPPENTQKPNPKFLSLLLQALIMAFVISLFFIFVGVAAIIFLHLCIAGGALHRRRNRRRPVSGDGELPSGLSADSLKAIPIERLNVSEICAICLENVEKGEFVRVLSGCNHVFHLDCVDKWLMKVPACPTCRSSVSASGRDIVEEVDRSDGFDWERLWGACG